MKIVGCDSRGMPSETYRNIDWKVVLTLSEDDKTVAAYRGEGSQEWVMNCGSKVSLEECLLHFPSMKSWMDEAGYTYRK